MESLQNVKTKDIAKVDIEKIDSSCNLIAQSNDVHGDGNFLQGCSFSPDGLCILTHTVSDAKLRLYNTPLQSSLSNNNLMNDNEVDSSIVTGETAAAPTAPTPQDWATILSSDCGDSVRCYAWYPMMKSSDPGTCCFVAASRYVFQS
jgi:WD40 repeat protein